MKPLSPILRASITRDANLRAANAVFAAKEKRPSVMAQLAEASAASDARTARLRALRLEKEKRDGEPAPDQGRETAFKPAGLPLTG